MNSNSSKSLADNTVLIIGAGWSGLACAVTLAHQGYKVCLLESARQAGGRARRVKFKNFQCNNFVDNGQHIMLGAYHSTLRLFKRLGIKQQNVLLRQKLQLSLYSARHPLIQLKTSSLPAPFHLLTAFIKMQGMTYYERYKIIKMALNLAFTGYTLKQDVSVSELLKKQGQTDKIISALWEPLCLATMNTPIDYASAQVFLNVLKDSFSQHNEDSDLLFFQQDLSQTFCSPAIEFITQHGGQLHCAEKVTSLDISEFLNDSLQQSQAQSPQKTQHPFIIKSTKHNYKCHTLVLATPAYITEHLLAGKDSPPFSHRAKILKPTDASLHYQYEPICTLYMQYPPSVILPDRMTGFFNSTAQWAIDRSLCNQPGLIAVIISGSGKHLSLPHHLLAERVHQELGLCHANLPKALNYQIIIEQRATFSCRVNIERQRPKNDTLITGLFLAGDYTNTHYPSTLEGAVRSGCLAAEKIIAANSKSHFTQ